MADPSTCPPLIPASIEEAHGKIKGYIHKTPLVTCKTINKIASSPDPTVFFSSSSAENTSRDNGQVNNATQVAPKFNLYFKCESQQKIGAFKARGAFHALTHLISLMGIDELRRRGVVTHSSGNHAQALALAAHTFEIPAYIVMPTISTPSKIAGTQMYTSNVIFSGSTSVEREAKVEEVIAQTNAILVPPYDHPDIILGQGTAAYEMESQYQSLKSDASARFDAVLAPLGGGGLLSGTATWFSHTHRYSDKTRDVDITASSSDANTKQTLVFGTEPSHEGANDAERGLKSDPPERIPHVKSLTIADGLRTPVGVIPWSIVSDTSKVRSVYSATDHEIKLALKVMMERTKLFLEPSAVVPVAVLLFNRQFRDWVARQQEEQGVESWDVGIILSGGNTTVEALTELYKDGVSLRDVDKHDTKVSSNMVATADGSDANGVHPGEREVGKVGLDGERKAEDIAG